MTDVLRGRRTKPQGKFGVYTRRQVRYLGEWHSHPKNSTTHPSITDIRQLAWLAGSLAPEGIPTLMMIVGDDDIEVIMAKMES
jgi:integrative and conjugative element protein (TIGR02256 family)